MYAARSIARAPRTTLILLSAGMAACGGGGGGGVAATPAALVSIDEDNAETIAREVLSVGVDSADLGVSTGGSGILAADGGASALAVHLAGRRTIQAAGQVQASAIGDAESEFDCLVSGTLSLSEDLDDPDTLQSGDEVTAVFDACDDGEGAVYDGQLRIEVQSFTGDLFEGLYRLDSRFVMTDLAITKNGITETGNGTLNVDMDLRIAGLETYDIESTLFTLTSGATTWIVRDLVSFFEDDYRDEEWRVTLDESGSLESSSFAGRVDYGTTTPFVSVDGGYPRAGVLRIDGANGTSVLVTVLDEEELQLEIDRNGDEVVDETLLLNWEDIPGW
jgi:hypothetical protein